MNQNDKKAHFYILLGSVALFALLMAFIIHRAAAVATPVSNAIDAKMSTHSLDQVIKDTTLPQQPQQQ
jgi:hypothetical protein